MYTIREKLVSELSMTLDLFITVVFFAAYYIWSEIDVYLSTRKKKTKSRKFIFRTLLDGQI